MKSWIHTLAVAVLVVGTFEALDRFVWSAKPVYKLEVPYSDEEYRLMEQLDVYDEVWSPVRQKARFYIALFLTETSGRSGPIMGDGGKSRGPLQISRAYWEDAVAHRPHLRKYGYEHVDDFVYACLVADAYFDRYAKTALENLDFEALARTHNGGPDGRNKQSTLIYWNRVQGHLLAVEE